MDVMEGLGGSAAYHFHSPSGGPGSSVGGDYTGWHIFAGLWEPGSVTFYYDNVEVGKISTGITGAPQYLILNNGIGGYGGARLVPSDMQVDWVHVYSHDASAVAVAAEDGYTGPGGTGGGTTPVATNGDDTLVGGSAADAIHGLRGNDSILGGGGNDSLWGGGGNDTIDGGAGVNMLVGDRHDAAGNDTFIVHNSGDVIVELPGAGKDTVLASVSYKLAANVEDLTLTGPAAIDETGNALHNVMTGNGAANTLLGNGGDDTLTGGAGHDVLNGGAGKDLLYGGGDDDRFVFGALADSGPSSTQRDAIVDFEHGDRIDLSALDAKSGVSGNQAFSFVHHFAHAAGQLQSHEIAAHTFLVEGDVNGDGHADFSLKVKTGSGFVVLHGSDFVL
jgi:Ca2+-binding RTX toxin-like protein